MSYPGAYPPVQTGQGNQSAVIAATPGEPLAEALAAELRNLGWRVIVAEQVAPYAREARALVALVTPTSLNSPALAAALASRGTSLIPLVVGAAPLPSGPWAVPPIIFSGDPVRTARDIAAAANSLAGATIPHTPPMFPQPSQPYQAGPFYPMQAGYTRYPQGDAPYGSPAPAKPRWPMIVGVIVAVTLLLCVAGGAFAYTGLNKLARTVSTSTLPLAQATCDLTTHHCNKAPIMTINPSKTYIATIETAKGNIVIQLDAKHAPLATNNFVFLAQQHFYDGLYFWRVEIPGQPSVIDGQPSTLSLIQGATVAKNGEDPSSIPGYTFNDEKVVGDYVEGAVAMANGGPNTNGAQFFICTGDNSKQLSKNYTIFGKVISGLDVAKKIAVDDVIKTVTIQVM